MSESYLSPWVVVAESSGAEHLPAPGFLLWDCFVHYCWGLVHLFVLIISAIEKGELFWEDVDDHYRFLPTAWPLQGWLVAKACFLEAVFKCILVTDRLGPLTISPGNLFCSFTALPIQKCFLMPTLNLPCCCSFELFPHVPLLDPGRWDQHLPPSSPPQEAVDHGKVTPMVYYFFLLFSKPDSPKVPNCSFS